MTRPWLYTLLLLSPLPALAAEPVVKGEPDAPAAPEAAPAETPDPAAEAPPERPPFTRLVSGPLDAGQVVFDVRLHSTVPLSNTYLSAITSSSSLYRYVFPQVEGQFQVGLRPGVAVNAELGTSPERPLGTGLVGLRLDVSPDGTDAPWPPMVQVLVGTTARLPWAYVVSASQTAPPTFEETLSPQVGLLSVRGAGGITLWRDTLVYGFGRVDLTADLLRTEINRPDGTTAESVAPRPLGISTLVGPALAVPLKGSGALKLELGWRLDMGSAGESGTYLVNNLDLRIGVGGVGHQTR